MDFRLLLEVCLLMLCVDRIASMTTMTTRTTATGGRSARNCAVTCRRIGIFRLYSLNVRYLRIGIHDTFGEFVLPLVVFVNPLLVSVNLPCMFIAPGISRGCYHP